MIRRPLERPHRRIRMVAVDDDAPDQSLRIALQIPASRARGRLIGDAPRSVVRRPRPARQPPQRPRRLTEQHRPAVIHPDILHYTLAVCVWDTPSQSLIRYSGGSLPPALPSGRIYK